MQRYLHFNSNADGYTWKRFGRELNLQLSLEENGIVDELYEFKELNMEPHYPAVHIYFDNLVDKQK